MKKVRVKRSKQLYKLPKWKLNQIKRAARKHGMIHWGRCSESW